MLVPDAGGAVGVVQTPFCSVCGAWQTGVVSVELKIKRFSATAAPSGRTIVAESPDVKLKVMVPGLLDANVGDL